MELPWYAGVEGLRPLGFKGFLTIKELRRENLSPVPGGVRDIGVYVVVRPEAERPTFLLQSTGGRFKAKNPNVAQDLLTKNWLLNSQIVYVGKAGSQTGSATLKSRLRQYLNFGAGKPIGHWGGRYTWHLPNADELLVCWKITPDQEPRNVEREMLAEFEAVHGARPFANLAG